MIQVDQLQRIADEANDRDGCLGVVTVGGHLYKQTEPTRATVAHGTVCMGRCVATGPKRRVFTELFIALSEIEAVGYEMPLGES